MVNSDGELIDRVTIDDLVAKYFELGRKIEMLEGARHALYVEIVRHAEEEEAELLPTTEGLIEVKQKVQSYDPSRLSALKEITDPDLLTESGVYTPEHEVTVPETTKLVKERWDGRKLGKIAKLGKEHTEIIERSKVMSRHTIKKVETDS